MELTGYEKRLEEYTKNELVEIAERYTIYYQTKSGQGRTGSYNRLTKHQLISLIKNDQDYKDQNPSYRRRRPDGRLITDRFKELLRSIYGNETPEDLMNEILNRAQSTIREFPEPGKYYTYIYYAKTPNIFYDRHPLIRCGEILEKGFYGLNYHWGEIRQYNTVDGDRLVSDLYEISSKELITLRKIPYGKKIRT
jgi:hypothetical protein